MADNRNLDKQTLRIKVQRLEIELFTCKTKLAQARHADEKDRRQRDVEKKEKELKDAQDELARADPKGR
jgi:predicted FMN-binding regulatory protein PaiB